MQEDPLSGVISRVSADNASECALSRILAPLRTHTSLRISWKKKITARAL